MKKDMKTFNTKHVTEFSEWWTALALSERQNFIRDVYPTIVQSLTDRWCLVGGNMGSEGVKTYEARYDRYLSILPEFTVEYLSAGSNLPSVIASWNGSDCALTGEISDRAVNLRSLCRANAYPWRVAEYRRQYNVQPDDKVYILVPHGPGSRDSDFNPDEQLGEHMLVIDDPSRFLNGCGTPSPLGGGHTVNLFEMGVFVLPFEYDAVMEVIYVFQHLLALLVDEYKEDVLGSQVGG
jgi:hypothetical protein